MEDAIAVMEKPGPTGLCSSASRLEVTWQRSWRQTILTASSVQCSSRLPLQFGPGTGVQAQLAFLEPSKSDGRLGEIQSSTTGYATSAASRNSSSRRPSTSRIRPSKIEDCIAWASETSAETLIDTVLGRFLSQPDEEQTYRKDSLSCSSCARRPGRHRAICPWAKRAQVHRSASPDLGSDRVISRLHANRS